MLLPEQPIYVYCTKESNGKLSAKVYRTPEPSDQLRLEGTGYLDENDLINSLRLGRWFSDREKELGFHLICCEKED